MLSEFDLIDRFFLQRARSAHARGRAAHLGIGDDCALLRGRSDIDYAVSTDMLVAGRHFFADIDPFRLGHKCLAVNLSDLAAMGAEPLGFTLSLALPEADESWLESFSAGLFDLAEKHDCELIGGDTTKGPLTINITIFGGIPHEEALRRDAAQVGDDIWVSGTLGDARLALSLFRQEWLDSIPADKADPLLAAVRPAMEMPTPRIGLGMALRKVAHAAIDISDGLAGDLAHILKKSNVRARIFTDSVPRSKWLAAQTEDIQRTCTLAGGDDYELCFTAPALERDRVMAIGAACGVAVTRIGEILPPAAPAPHLAAVAASAARIDWTDKHGAPLTFSLTGFDHFNVN